MTRQPRTLAFLLLLPLCLAATKQETPADVRPFTQKIPGSSVSFEMVPVPGGTFTMGSPPSEKGRKDDEGPQFRVTVEPFYIGKCEVTWGEYREFTSNFRRLSGSDDSGWRFPTDKLADAVTYPTPVDSGLGGMEGFLKDRGTPGPRFPAVSMSQFAAKQYTEWLSKKTGRFYRLPSEAEWEYACRAGTTTAYSFGEDPEKLKEHAWCAANSQWQDDLWYRRVGRKQPNAWGLDDMYGNVAEWCIDQYDADWYRRFDGKTVNWHDTINWPKTRYPCVIRGGSYQSQPQDCRSAARLGSSRMMNRKDPQYPKSPHWEFDGVWVGIRVVSPVKEPTDEEKRRWWFDPDPVTAKTIERDREHHEIVKPPKPEDNSR